MRAGGSSGGRNCPNHGGILMQETTVSGWFDSHCHIQDQYLPEGADAVAALVEAHESGVGGVVCVGTDAASSAGAIALAGRSPSEPGAAGGCRVWATVGLHPHQAVEGVAPLAELLEGAAAELPGAVVAVGECGLDYHYDHSPRDAQLRAFREQVRLAKQHGLALVVHTREAWDDTFDLLESEGPPERLVMHCFTGGPEEARRCLQIGAYLSFSGIVTFRNAEDVREAALACPAERLLVETDAPFLAPVPHRGKPNRPAWVRLVGESLAALRGSPPEELAASSRAAAMRVFAIG